ncbi:unnamed protein product [Mytilus coruscus]|uniref:Uncharacterized protein n=1 Tax=Mytilus coruscus TaxID=42192 RepID=A0A6J8DD47_MYTCO|nr:unnamed protein product [Mytilus coruscus]
MKHRGNTCAQVENRNNERTVLKRMFVNGNCIPSPVPVPYMCPVGTSCYSLPEHLKDYFMEKGPEGYFSYETDYSTIPLLTPIGIMSITLELPEDSCCFGKFNDFVHFGLWSQKTVRQIPGIGKSYRRRMKNNLNAYFSVPQLYDMFRYWLCKGVPLNFLDLIRWASSADNNNGNWHTKRTYEAFRQKHVLSCPSTLPVMNMAKAVDPAPFVLEE